MKILLVLLFLLSGVCNAQLKNNSIYLTFQPIDFGFGARYDRKISPIIGIYSSLSYGKFQLPYGGYIKDHIRGVVGVLRYVKPYHNSYPSFGIGLIYSHYGDQNITIPNFSDIALYPFSFELCVGTKLLKRFTAGVRFDFMKNESALDFGCNF